MLKNWMRANDFTQVSSAFWPRIKASALLTKGETRMNSFRFHLKAMLLVLFSLAMASIASAQESYVASNGSDGGTCSRTAPCRTIDYALSQIAAGGTVVALDSGQYPRFTVDKAATVVAAPGVYAEVQAAGTSGVTVSAGGTVVLRGLAIKDYSALQQIGAAGIKYLNGTRLIIEDCIVSHFSVGIDLTGNELLDLLVRNTEVRQCGIGISITGTRRQLLDVERPDLKFYTKASIEGCRVESNSFAGILAQDTALVTVRNTVAAGNRAEYYKVGSSGFRASASVLPFCPVMTIENCVATGNDFGISLNQSTGVIYLSNSTISNNKVWGIVGGVNTRRNNTIEWNGESGQENISGSLSPFSAK